MAATIILLIVGVALLVTEMFTPGLGVPGLVGVGCFLAAIILQINNTASMIFMIALVLFLLAVALAVFMKVFSSDKFARKSRLVLRKNIEGVSTNLKEESQQAYIGRPGIALTPLRPSGKAEIAGNTLDVSTNGEFLPAGAKIEVKQVEGLRILVQAVPEE